MRELSFSVDGVLEEPTRLFIGGRNCGDLLRVGDQFTSARRDPDRSSDADRPISLRLRSILVYGKFMNQIDPGLTAELELERLADARPLAREVLAGSSSLPAFAAYEVLGAGQFKSRPD